jgi:hypothetical protein
MQICTVFQRSAVVIPGLDDQDPENFNVQPQIFNLWIVFLRLNVFDPENSDSLAAQPQPSLTNFHQNQSNSPTKPIKSPNKTNQFPLFILFLINKSHFPHRSSSTSTLTNLSSSPPKLSKEFSVP